MFDYFIIATLSCFVYVDAALNATEAAALKAVFTGLGEWAVMKERAGSCTHQFAKAVMKQIPSVVTRALMGARVQAWLA